MIILALLLAIGILYSDDPDIRSARMIRATITIIAFSTALAAGHALVGLLFYESPVRPMDLVNVLGAIQRTAVPISIAERVAGLFRPHREPLWALVGVSAALAGSCLTYLLLGRGSNPPLPWLAAFVEFGTPGIVAGLAWYAFLPRRDRHVGKIFE